MSRKRLRSLQDLLWGPPLRSRDEQGRKLGVFEGLPVFGLDGLSSAAYGPEAALTILLPLGASGLHYILPITVGIGALLLLLYFSYRQGTAAYPVNGGTYSIAKDNLGVTPALLAAAALMIDYVLNVAVGIAAGVGALVSAAPALQNHTLLVCLAILAALTVTNLRGTKEAGWAVAGPTYLFIGSLGTVLLVGVGRVLTSGGHPQPLAPPPELPAAIEPVGVWLLLRSFAAGCSALTGVEAVSNGVTAFKEPAVQRARATLTLIVVVLGLMLAGVAYLAGGYGIGALDQNQPGYQSILSQLTAAVVGTGWCYYVTMASVLAVLCLSANTSFADFPRLCQLLATDGFLPRSFAVVGRRLVYTAGVLGLTAAAGLLLFAFNGITDRLIPLFATSAFTVFLLAQLGLVVHWRKRACLSRPGAGDCAQQAVADAGTSRGRAANGAADFRRIALAAIPIGVNAMGAAGTAVALAIILVAKFTEGAWIVILAFPLLVAFFRLVHRYYDKLAKATQAGPAEMSNHQPPVVMLPIRGWDKPAAKSLRFAMWLSDDVIAVHLNELTGTTDDPQDHKLQAQWARFVEEPARQAGVPLPRLRVVSTPYREFENPLLAEIGRIEQEFPGRMIAVAIPLLVPRQWWQVLFHMRRSHRLRAALLKRGDRRVVVMYVPWYLHD